MADAYIGEIRAFAGTYAPVDWNLCDGTILNVSGNEALYSLIGNTYGGTSPNTFALPDLRGRLVVGQGTGPSLSPRTIGTTGGTENVTCVTANLPAHTHAMNVSNATSGNVQTPGITTYLGTPQLQNPPAGATAVAYLPSTATGATPQTMNAGIVTPIGGSQPHTNMMPCMAITYIICVNGLYPTRP